MFENVGAKIKILAKVVCVLLILASLVGAITSWSSYPEDYAYIGFVILILGSLSAIVSSWFLYGFGEIVENVALIQQNQKAINANSANKAKTDEEKLNNLNKLLAEGLISEQEYQDAIKK